MNYKINYTIGGSKLNPNAEPFIPAAKTIFKPETKEELKTAVNEWVLNKTIAESKYGDINTWDTSLITDMSRIFAHGYLQFNGDASNWDVSKIIDMSQFNDNISNWDVSNVTDMSNMFNGAIAFNGDISKWNVSAVTNMERMFRYANAFNGDISSWDVSSVTNMYEMFFNATAFNGVINTKEVTINENIYTAWDVSKVTDMENMFSSATAFNGDISSWDVSSVTNMSYMFNNATAFNQDIGLWNIGSNTKIHDLFKNSGVTRQTFLPKSPTNPVTNPGQYGTGRGIYGNVIANYFNPPLPNPKTIEELQIEREKEANWQRRKHFMMVISETKNSTGPSTTSKEIVQDLGNPDSGLGRKIFGYVGGSNN